MPKLKFKEGNEVKVVDGWAKGRRGTICSYKFYGIYRYGGFYIKIDGTRYEEGDCHRIEDDYLEKLTPLEKAMR